jgi:hypothetical protein
MTRNEAFGLAVCVMIAWTPTRGLAQDSHYWTEQFGTRATLLGGATIGSARDLGAVYYNPGAIVLLENPGFVLAAQAYQLSTYSVVHDETAELDLATSTTKPLPTLFAGSPDWEFLGRGRFAYSLLTRQQLEVGLADASGAARDVLPEPGDEDVASGLDATISLNDLWVGLSYSYPLTSTIGVGITQFHARRSHSLGSALVAQAATQSDQVAIVTRVRRREYTNYRILWKLGIALEQERLSLGLNATTSSIRLGGTGAAIYNFSATGIDLTGDGTPDPRLASNAQTELEAEYRTPWSVGLGGSYALRGTRFHTSAEWFSSPEPYALLDAATFTSQTGGAVLDNDLTAQVESVINWAFAAEQSLGSRTSVYLSYAVDHSVGADDAPASDFVLTRYDITRVGAGVAFVLAGSDITLGVGWAGGESPFGDSFDQEIPVPPAIAPGSGPADLRFRQWTAVIGIEFGG